PGRAPRAVLFPPGPCGLPGNSCLARRAWDSHFGGRQGASARLAGSPDPRLGCSVPAVPPGELRRRGAPRCPVLPAGNPRAVPACALGICLLAHGLAPGSDPALSLEARDDPARGGVAAKPGLRHVPRAGTAPDRLGLRAVGPPRSPHPLAVPLARP